MKGDVSLLKETRLTAVTSRGKGNKFVKKRIFHVQRIITKTIFYLTNVPSERISSDNCAIYKTNVFKNDKNFGGSGGDLI